jgi:hypothetical protein
MRLVATKTTPKKQNTTEDKTVDTTQKRTTQIQRDLQISTDLKTFSNSKYAFEEKA